LYHRWSAGAKRSLAARAEADMGQRDADAGFAVLSAYVRCGLLTSASPMVPPVRRPAWNGPRGARRGEP
jgi:hypothetical protein